MLMETHTGIDTSVTEPSLLVSCIGRVSQTYETAV